MEHTYFESIPVEIVPIILSKLDVDTVGEFSFISYDYLILLQKEYTWMTLFKYGYPGAYDFVNNATNIDKLFHWKDLKEEYDNPKKISIHEVNTVADIYYFNLISIKYPHIYEVLKDINLKHGGMDYANRNPLNWYWIYYVLNNITSNTEFVKDGVISIRSVQTCEELIKQSLIKGDIMTTLDDVIQSRLIYYYILYKTASHFINYDSLFVFFVGNTDMYENLFKICNKKIFDNIKYEDINSFLTRYYSSSSSYLKSISPFMSDIKKKMDILT